MAKGKRVRLTISVSEDVNERLERLAERMGVTKTQACSIMIGQSLFSWEQTWGLFSNPQFMAQIMEAADKNPEGLFAKSIKEGEMFTDEVINKK